MIESAVVEALRVAGQRSSPADTARLLETLLPEGLRQDTLVFYVKQAVPAIPLKVLLDAQGWSAVGPGSINDGQFNEMLRPWWPAESGREDDREMP
jgi:hypothetical protein